MATRTVPVTVVGGYLGAGKTTLVNHLLRHAEGRRLVVMVNDFGDTPIDAALIAARDGDTAPELERRGAPRILLATAVENEPAQRLFASLGFRTTMVEMTREATST